MTPNARLGATVWHITVNFGMDFTLSVLSMNENKLRAIVAGEKQLSRVDAKKVLDLAFIYDSLLVNFSNAFALAWLKAANLDLSGDIPLERIIQGDTQAVHLALTALQEGERQ